MCEVGEGVECVCVLNVCLGALSRLISVRFGVDQVYAAYVCVCAEAMMS